LPCGGGGLSVHDMKPVIFGLSGLTLTDNEKRLFRDVEPAGYILF
jgi:beta-N-acetylhexosaminidase